MQDVCLLNALDKLITGVAGQPLSERHHGLLYFAGQRKTARIHKRGRDLRHSSGLVNVDHPQ